MAAGTKGVVVTAGQRQRESFDNPDHGDLSWVTLISGELTPTTGMSAGVTELEPGGIGLALHRHAEPEIYYIVGGSGVVTIDGVATAVVAGAAVFIPGDAEHGLRNTGAEILKVFYVFPTDRFSDVVYRFTPPPGSA